MSRCIWLFFERNAKLSFSQKAMLRQFALHCRKFVLNCAVYAKNIPTLLGLGYFYVRTGRKPIYTQTLAATIIFCPKGGKCKANPVIGTPKGMHLLF